jgi:hypothetical protein
MLVVLEAAVVVTLVLPLVPPAETLVVPLVALAMAMVEATVAVVVLLVPPAPFTASDFDGPWSPPQAATPASSSAEPQLVRTSSRM